MGKLSSDTHMDATTSDPHHDGIDEWGVLSNNLYIRAKSSPRPKWNLVKRVSYTPKRMLAIAGMINTINIRRLP